MKLKKRQFTKLQQIAFTVNQILPGTGVALDKLIADIESVQKPKEEFGFIDADQLKKDFRSGSPFFESLKEEARDIFFKEGKNAVENSLSDRSTTKGVRNLVENLGTIAIKGALKKQRTKLDKAMNGNSGFATGGVCTEEEQNNTLSPEEQRNSNLSDYLNRTGAWSAENTVTYNVTVPKNRKYKGTGEKLNGVMDVETGSDLEKFLDPLMAHQIGDIGYFWDDTDMYKVIRYGVLKAIKKGDIEPYKVNDVYYENFSKTPPELK